MEPGGQRVIEYKSKTDVFNFSILADFHVGNKACALELLKQDIKAIEQDGKAIWLGIGDYAEFIGPGDNRFDPDVVPDNIRVKDLGRLGAALMEQVRDLLYPIRNKCLGILQGNHERKYELAKDQEGLTEWLAVELGTKCLGYSTIFDLIFQHKPKQIRGQTTTFRIFAHHGAGFAQTPGGKLNRLDRFMDDWPYADLVVMGHVHEEQCRPKVRLDADAKCTRIVQRVQRGIITGSYLKTFAEGVTTYAEQKGYRPVALGATVVRIKPYTRETAVIM